ncbi:hypothetical protein PINS_up012641 [Pythium insidiosum]|nr:hypothetical protein PINS_up012641 [Pythium insidiosum]
MGGHQDDVEYTMDHPVVSLSLGSRCVFLKGGTTKDEAPLSVLLQSGDIAILSGASRLSFHGVAKILPSPFEIKDAELSALVEKKKEEEEEEEHDGDDGVEDWADELRAVRAYLGTHRVNINIRQVFADPTTDTEASQESERESKTRDAGDGGVHDTGIHAPVALKRRKTSN